MTEDELKMLHERLLTRLEKEKEKILTLREITKPIELSNTIGRLSRMDAINNKSVNEAALRESQAKVKRMEYSLDKFGSADFGKCVNCRADIQFKRLFALPDSVKCIKCASK